RECQLERLDAKSRELEYARYFSEVERERHKCRVENLPIEIVVEMGSLSVNEVSTSGRTTGSDSEVEVGLEQFLSFPGQLISYPPSSDAFQEFCVKSHVERKESLLDEVTEEEAELKFVLEGLDFSRKKRVDSWSKKI
ncbi:hypothetical protein GIB67_021930, partial [Kingdonia uniflora]